MVQHWCIKYCWYWCWRQRGDAGHDSEDDVSLLTFLRKSVGLTRDQEDERYGARSYYEHSDLKSTRSPLSNLLMQLWAFIMGGASSSSSQTRFTDEDFSYMMEDRLESGRLHSNYEGSGTLRSKPLGGTNSTTLTDSGPYFYPTVQSDRSTTKKSRYNPPEPTLPGTMSRNYSEDSSTMYSSQDVPVDNLMFESIYNATNPSPTWTDSSSVSSYGRESLYYSVVEPSVTFSASSNGSERLTNSNTEDVTS
ncbi:hypothetical protein PROFUN_11001 [Planoprotostelium fungivorum]|uniref:Uncharacterized protein n=1 Tax=Planoprotostelium fungivorum TaxID=1890364 RepID=A0A2P6NBZ2_9EUKA|nr:hypothetical protein PROFUN_11001 [Planoprotostelium fungivorum]